MPSKAGNDFGSLDERERLVLAALASGPEWEDQTNIVCNTCGDSYVHLVTCGVQQNDTLHMVCNDGLHLLRGLPPLGRGSAVVTIYTGECGHSFAVVQRFHKGQTLVGAVDLPADFMVSSTLWRK